GQCRISAEENSLVRSRGTCMVRAENYATVQAFDRSRVTARHHATVVANDRVVVDLEDDATVRAGSDVVVYARTAREDAVSGTERVYRTVDVWTVGGPYDTPTEWLQRHNVVLED